jgi:iron complex transport system ATP-binding protein
VLEAFMLSCGYGPRTVFGGVQLTACPGELLAILGPNGSGKTTLLRALARLIRPQAGQVRLNGIDIWTCRPAEVARVVTFAPQALEVDWPFTVREFVALGRAPHRGWWRPLTREDRQIVDAAVDRLGLTLCRHRPLTELSGGEWQRVRLARAMAQQPRVLLLDEPTAHLDPRFQFELMTAIRDLTRRGGLAVVVTLHDLNLVGPWADRVALLAEGGLHAVGAPQEVLTTETLAAAYGVRLAVAPHPLTSAPAIAIAPVEEG